MRVHISARAVLRAVALGLGVLLAAAGDEARAGGGTPPRGTVSREYAEARALFEKLWEPGEAAPSGGDGVGPLFNERSCVGCHNQGGTGGGGDNTKNVTILSAQADSHVVPIDRNSIFQGNLENLHPAFRGRTSIVLHKHSTSDSDKSRLETIGNYHFVQTRDELLVLSRSHRSTPALFGAGRIDAIPDKALIAAEARTFPKFPEITGRVSRLRDGRLGKFGWKGQTASLQDFVMAACANELGLEVVGRHQPTLQTDREFDGASLALDLSREETALMTRFVANLPSPILRRARGSDLGPAVFESIGCASCHTPNLGDVHGLYSDLLLHDLGDRTRAFGGGYGGGSTATIVDNASAGKDRSQASGEAGPTEWRTTPLWGVADSAPYLHDGRARTLHDAIMLHGGEAEKTMKRYEALPSRLRQALMAFLKSQVAPDQPGRPVDRTAKRKRNPPDPSPPGRRSLM